MKTQGKLSTLMQACRNCFRRGCLVAIAMLFTVSSAFYCKAATPVIVQNIADLKTLNISGANSDTVALVLDYYGYSSRRGRAGGHFRWITTAVAGTLPADDGGRFIASTAMSGGIWERMLQGEVANVRMWGAKGDGSTDDYVPIQKAVDACNDAWANELLFTTGTYRVTNTIVFPAQIHIHGEGNGNNTMIRMPAGIQKDIFRTANANTVMNGGTANWDSFLVFENLFLSFDGTLETRNKSNSGLVVCMPCEGHVIRDIITQNGAFGIRCLGGGAPGLRVRDCTVSDAAIAGISIEPLPNQVSCSGDPISLIGVSGDQRWDDCAQTASLIRFTNVVTGGRITEIKAEGTFGGGVVQFQYPPASEGWGGGAMANVTIENVSYNGGVTYGNYDYTRDFVVLKGQLTSASLNLHNIHLYSVRDVIYDQVNSRHVEADINVFSGLAQQTCMIPLAYLTQNDGGPQGTNTRLTMGQTAFSYLYATNQGWYRVMIPQGIGTVHITGKLVISCAGRESTEIQIDVNPYSGNPNGAWLNVTRCMGNNGTLPPVITQARGFYYYDTVMGGNWAFVDVYVGNPITSAYVEKMKRFTFALDINGYETFGTGMVGLIGSPYSVSATLPSGAVSSTVNTYR
ncbi:MAG: hypothetical protein JWQ71_4076 [Pedosphaera sp.]|nr:hypothetical protein [Pedosphaera sp.]